MLLIWQADKLQSLVLTINTYTDSCMKVDSCHTQQMSKVQMSLKGVIYTNEEAMQMHNKWLVLLPNDV